MHNSFKHLEIAVCSTFSDILRGKPNTCIDSAARAERAGSRASSWPYGAAVREEAVFPSIPAATVKSIGQISSEADAASTPSSLNM